MLASGSYIPTKPPLSLPRPRTILRPQPSCCRPWVPVSIVSPASVRRTESRMRGTMRVLIVDDEPLAQTALANILAARSDVEHFDSAKDAVEALDRLAKDPYDVLLLDINMPELSGTELVDQLRERGHPLPSIVFVT